MDAQTPKVDESPSSQELRILHRSHDFFDVKTCVYVGRPSRFGNPFIIGEHGTREEVIEKFREYLMRQPDLIAAAKQELKGKDLMCWCDPLPCHASVLMEVANS